MRRCLIHAGVALVAFVSAAHAQGAIKLSDVAGTWVMRSTIGPNDSVVVRSVLIATADPKRWVMRFPGRPPIPVRVAATGGDSVVTEAGPYPSIIRPGQTVNVLRNVLHFKGGTVTGTFEAHYASGDVVHGQATGTRSK